jgi:hypothetical protein
LPAVTAANAEVSHALLALAGVTQDFDVSSNEQVTFSRSPILIQRATLNAIRCISIESVLKAGAKKVLNSHLRGEQALSSSEKNASCRLSGESAHSSGHGDRRLREDCAVRSAQKCATKCHCVVPPRE